MSLGDKRALVLGASGGLGSAVAAELLQRGVRVALVSRQARIASLQEAFAASLADGSAKLCAVQDRYTEYDPAADPWAPYDLVVFTQALFQPTPLAEMSEARIADEVAVGLTEQILLTRALLAAHPPSAHRRLDVCFTGSTSAYQGFANTSVYCAVKHGLVGFIRALNEEYAATDARFWLFSMGSMDTEMGKNVPLQDRLTFLKAPEVAQRMVEAVLSPTNLFEP